MVAARFCASICAGRTSLTTACRPPRRTVGLSLMSSSPAAAAEDEAAAVAAAAELSAAAARAEGEGDSEARAALLRRDRALTARLGEGAADAPPVTVSSAAAALRLLMAAREGGERGESAATVSDERAAITVSDVAPHTAPCRPSQRDQLQRATVARGCRVARQAKSVARCPRPHVHAVALVEVLRRLLCRLLCPMSSIHRASQILLLRALLHVKIRSWFDHED